MMIQAKDFKAGMLVEVQMKVSERSEKMEPIKIIIEEDVLFTGNEENVLVDFIYRDTGKSGAIMLNPNNKFKLIEEKDYEITSIQEQNHQ